MKRGTLIVLLLVVVGLLGIGGTYVVRSFFRAQTDLQSSDAADMKGKITVEIDSWVGYSVLASSRMKQEMRNNSYAFVCEDNPDLAERMRKLKNGEIDFAVATVDSYLLNAAPLNFPGLIVMVIDESFGGDAMVAYESEVPNLEALKTKPVKVAFTPKTPSHHLIKAAAAHFDIGTLRNIPANLRVETNDSSEAFNRFKKREASVAVLWEPDVSRALALPGVVRLIGTESTSKLVVDVLLVNREFAQAKPEVVKLVMGSYFRVLKYYREHPDEHAADVKISGDVTRDMVPKMLAGCRFVTLTENCHEWFGIGGEGGATVAHGLVDTIDSTMSILIDSGDFKSNPLPNKDPYRITNRSFLEQIITASMKTGFVGVGALGADASAAAVVQFSQLSPTQWDTLKEIGTLRVEPITFRSGTSELTLEGREQLDAIAERIAHYPRFRLIAKGHTDTRGDSDVNRELSQARADAVSRYLQVTHSVDPFRIRAVGFGGTKPAPKLIDESERAYHNRLSRVELALLTEVY